MEHQHTLLDLDIKFIEKWLILSYQDDGDNDDKAKKHVVDYMNYHRNYDKLLNFLKSSPDDVNQNLAYYPDIDLMMVPFEKIKLDLDIISNISSNTASKWLPELNSINLLKKIIDGKNSCADINTFLIKFLLRGLRNNSFLNAVNSNIHNLNHNIIKLLIRLIIAIKITYSNESALTNQLKRSKLMNKFEVGLVKKIFKESNSPFLIQEDELNKINKMQKKLNKLFKILNNKEVSPISLKSNSSSYKVLDKEKFDGNIMFEYLINFDDTVAHLIKRKDLELKECKDNVKEFSLREFNKYLNSNKDTYFIRKYKNKCYRFTRDDFFDIYDTICEHRIWMSTR